MGGGEVAVVVVERAVGSFAGVWQFHEGVQQFHEGVTVMNRGRGYTARGGGDLQVSGYT